MNEPEQIPCEEKVPRFWTHHKITQAQALQASGGRNERRRKARDARFNLPSFIFLDDTDSTPIRIVQIVVLELFPKLNSPNPLEERGASLRKGLATDRLDLALRHDLGGAAIAALTPRYRLPE